jgi:hypothetical protein
MGKSDWAWLDAAHKTDAVRMKRNRMCRSKLTFP